MTTATEYTSNPVQAFYWDGNAVTTDEATPPAEPVGGESHVMTEPFGDNASAFIIGQWKYYSSHIKGQRDELKKQVTEQKTEIDRLTARVAELEAEKGFWHRDSIQLCKKLTEIYEIVGPIDGGRVVDAVKVKIAELEAQLAARGMSAEEYERRLKLIGLQFCTQGLDNSIRRHFPPSLFSQPATPSDTDWHEPGEVPNSPWVIIRLSKLQEIAGLYLPKENRFIDLTNWCYRPEEITGWRYATAEPRGRRFEGRANLRPDGTIYHIALEPGQTSLWNEALPCTIIVHEKGGAS